MALIAKKSTKSTVPALAADTYIGRCVGIVDIGTQLNKNFGTYSHKVILIFEIAGETVMVDGEAKPRWISKDYTLSLNEKSALYNTLSAWFSQRPSDADMENGIDLSILLNRPAMVSISLTEKQDRAYNNIEAVTAVPKALTVEEAKSEQIYFDIDDWNDEMFNKLPEWIQDKIKLSDEYKGRMPQGTEEIDIKPEEKAEVKDDEDIPF